MSENLIRTMCWGDSASTATGFGIVNKYILSALYATGKYQIEQLAINHPARFVNTSEVPWQQIPARMLDPNEPYGKKMFLRAVLENDYDIIFILNDTYVTYDVAGQLRQILEQRRGAGKKIPKIIYYYPVDCHVQENFADMIKLADVPVCYNHYGRKETLKTIPEVLSKLRQIPHGVDTSVYHPLPAQTRSFLKSQYLKNNSGKFMFLNVNRNSDRKQLTRTILAFSEFKKKHSNSVLLLHTMPVDHSLGRTIDLFACVKDLGLSLNTDVLMPKNYEPSKAFPDKVMNEIYNIADCFMTTTLGEGHGLSAVEAAAAGTPVVIPNNTNARDLFGQSSERGYIYPCKDFTWVDNSGFRPFGHLPDIVDKMEEVFYAGAKENNKKIQAGLQWVQSNTWDIVCRQWVQLFDETLKKSCSHESMSENLLGELGGDLL